MKTIIQRVSHADVTIDGQVSGKIGRGLLVLLGVGPEDTEDTADYIAGKIVNMRIFEDENQKMNLSVRDIGGEILVVSQFTLSAEFHSSGRPKGRQRALRIFYKKTHRTGYPRGIRRVRRRHESQPSQRRPGYDSAGTLKSRSPMTRTICKGVPDI